ncbi:MAG: DUF4160 domain-containing protein [Firmicutes bacterium]|nr:DUF4160 domain-containing protein [Bacillota bacterium]
MPEISSFYGIDIYMYDESEGQHNLPHFHAYYAEKKCVIDINKCELLDGSMSKKQLKLILAWTEIHKEELMKDWNIAMQGRLTFKINPLI